MEISTSFLTPIIKEILKDKEKKEKLVEAVFEELLVELPKSITKGIKSVMDEGDFYDLVYDELRPFIRKKITEFMEKK